MSYRFAYSNGTMPAGGYGIDPNSMPAGYDYERSYSPESFSSESESDDYEYQARMITRESRPSRDVVRAPTPPPIIKRVVERAPTPEAPVMERVIIRPLAQEIVERVIEQPRTPPPRIVQKEMHEEAPPPIVRTRVIKVDRPILCGFSQPSSPYSHSGNPYRTQSIVGSIGRPAVYHNTNPNISSPSTFEYRSSPPMMMMPTPQQMMYQSAISRLPTYMYPTPQRAMPFGYHPMIPRGMPMPMMAAGGTTPLNGFPNQPSFFNPMIQPLVY